MNRGCEVTPELAEAALNVAVSQDHEVGRNLLCPFVKGKAKGIGADKGIERHFGAEVLSNVLHQIVHHSGGLCLGRLLEH